MTYDLTRQRQDHRQGQLRPLLRAGRHRRRRRARSTRVTAVTRPLSRGTTPTATSSSRRTKCSRPRRLRQRSRTSPATGIRRTRGAATTANTIDPNLKNDTTDEFIVGLDHEVGRGFAVGANYIWRKLRQLHVDLDTDGLDQRRLHRRRPSAPTCTIAGGAVRRRSRPAIREFHGSRRGDDDQLNHDRASTATFNGVELTGRKRMSHHWMMNTSFSYNSAIIQNYGARRTRHRGPEQHRRSATGSSTTTPRPAAASATSTSTPSGCSS